MAETLRERLRFRLVRELDSFEHTGQAYKHIGYNPEGPWGVGLTLDEIRLVIAALERQGEAPPVSAQQELR